MVVSPHGEGADLLGDDAVAVDGCGLGHGIQVGGVGDGRHPWGSRLLHLPLRSGEKTKSLLLGLVL